MKQVQKGAGPQGGKVIKGKGERGEGDTSPQGHRVKKCNGFSGTGGSKGQKGETGSELVSR